MQLVDISKFVDIIQMMHGSEWTLKYDEPEVENVARLRSLSATFQPRVIIFQCRTNDRASCFCRMANH